MNESALIAVISEHSDRYGDKLVDFMNRYGLKKSRLRDNGAITGIHTIRV